MLKTPEFHYDDATREERAKLCVHCGKDWGKHCRESSDPGGGFWRACKYQGTVLLTWDEPAPEVGIKHDTQKAQLSKYLHPLFANRHFLPIVVQVIEVLKYGAAKYQPDNWTKVTPKERYLDAALRHLSAVDNGKWLDDELDPEGNPGSGLPHVAHAACSVLMYGALALRDRKD